MIDHKKSNSSSDYYGLQLKLAGTAVHEADSESRLDESFGRTESSFDEAHSAKAPKRRM